MTAYIKKEDFDLRDQKSLFFPATLLLRFLDGVLQLGLLVITLVLIVIIVTIALFSVIVGVPRLGFRINS